MKKDLHFAHTIKSPGLREILFSHLKQNGMVISHKLSVNSERIKNMSKFDKFKL